MKASHVEPSRQFGGGLGWVPLDFPAAGTKQVPYRFEIAAVHGATAVTDVKVVTPAGVAGTDIISAMAADSTGVFVATLTSTVADRRGVAGGAIEVTGGTVTTIWIRPYPMKGEA